jgi:hypothetical protein
MTLNPTEEFVYQLCRHSFLSLWSYANPQGRTAGRELCDILVVCEPDVVIVSVKEVRMQAANGEFGAKYQRWTRRAIDESVAQIYGAERWINSGRQLHVVRADGRRGLAFPRPESRRIHRVAVALGAPAHFPLTFGDFGKGFVHVLDQRSFEIVLRELDTVTDFVRYLSAKEELYSSKDVRAEREETLLAAYLHDNRAFRHDFDLLLLEDDLWQQFSVKPEVQARNREDEVSYLWDKLIEVIADDVLQGNVEMLTELREGELALRTMARETRFGRRMLGDALNEFLHLAAEEKIEARMLRSHANVGYVFLALPPSVDSTYRSEQLTLRCLVARKDLKTDIVIGLGTEQPGKSRAFSWSLVYVQKPAWSEEDDATAEGIRRDFGYFAAPNNAHRHFDEYPPQTGG